jgi:hypothetical protein
LRVQSVRDVGLVRGQVRARELRIDRAQSMSVCAPRMPKPRVGPPAAQASRHRRRYAVVALRVLGPSLRWRTSSASSPAMCASTSAKVSGRSMTTPSISSGRCTGDIVSPGGPAGS